MRLSPIKEDKRIFFLRKRSLFSSDPCLFVQRFDATPVAELLELDLPLYQLLIFIGVIITTLADAATHRDQPVGMLYLGHGNDDTIFLQKTQQYPFQVKIAGFCDILNSFNRYFGILPPNHKTKGRDFII